MRSYDPNQPRDHWGKFTSGNGDAGVMKHIRQQFDADVRSGKIFSATMTGVANDNEKPSAATNQAREGTGRFVAGGNKGEQGQRDRSRYAVRVHAGQQSVGTHTGRNILGNIGKALLGTALGVASTFVGDALRSQRHGGRR